MATIEVQEPAENTEQAEEQQQQEQQQEQQEINTTDEKNIGDDENSDDGNSEDAKEPAETNNEEKADESKAVEDTIKATKESTEEAAKTLSEKGIDYGALTTEYEEKGKMKYNIALALSKFTAIMVGKPDNYKSKDGLINYYPSDCLYDWRYSTIDENGQIVNDPTNQPEEVAGITCKGVRYWNDEPQEMTVMFKDI